MPLRPIIPDATIARSVIIDLDAPAQEGLAPTYSAAPAGPAGGALDGTYPNPILADDAVTDATIGERTIDDATTHSSGTGLLTQLLSLLGRLIKGITGKASFTTAPAITLEATYTHTTHVATGSTLGHVKSSSTVAVDGAGVASVVAESSLQKLRFVSDTGSTLAEASRYHISDIGEVVASFIMNIGGWTDVQLDLTRLRPLGIQLRPLYLYTRAVSASDTLAQDDSVIWCNTNDATGTITLTAPATGTWQPGHVIYIWDAQHKAATHNIVFQRAGTDVFADGTTSKTINTNGDGLMAVCTPAGKIVTWKLSHA